MKKRAGFATVAVRGGEEGRFCHSPASAPLYQTSTFTFESAAEFGRVLSGDKEGFIYTRIGNPTVRAFEEKMALLEEGGDAAAFSSGMAAVSAVLLEMLTPGDEIISSSQVYGGSRFFFDRVLARFGCKVRYFSPHEDVAGKIPALVRKKTKLLFFETPSNPELSILDVSLIAGLADKYGLFSVIDNTFATPYLQRPLLAGVDCVLHSATKYIGGHGDALGGIAVSSKEFIGRLKGNMLSNLGGCLSPFNSWLFLRGLKTLHVRMDYHCMAAARIADFLSGHPKVRQVLYPGLETHAGHKIAGRQMKGFGGVVSFRLESRAECEKFVNSLGICRVGVSLGDVETLFLHAASMLHKGRSDAECRKVGVDPLLIRISTGLEDPDDIIQDIKGALKKI